MTLMFEKIKLEKISPFIVESKVITSGKTRLGGDIVHLLTASQKEVFVKIGTGYESLEISREYKNISTLRSCFSVPKICDYKSTNNQSMIILEKMPGLPFHKMISSLGYQSSLSLMKDILHTIYEIPNNIKKNFEIAVLQELEDIQSLIANNKIKQDNFIKASEGRTLLAVYHEIQNELKNHTQQTLSHGDFCLPNILVTPEKKWSLIDWGKAGLGDPCRDLSALSCSLERNMDEKAFPKLCNMMTIDVTPNFQNKINFYKSMDLFWYHADLQK